MSARSRIIHLHGGPSDGLCLTWQDEIEETKALNISRTVALPEYDYIYVPRVAGGIRYRSIHLTDSPAQGKIKPGIWCRIWTVCRDWLLTPCSYPLDTRHLQVHSRVKDSSLKKT